MISFCIHPHSFSCIPPSSYSVPVGFLSIPRRPQMRPMPGPPMAMMASSARASLLTATIAEPLLLGLDGRCGGSDMVADEDAGGRGTDMPREGAIEDDVEAIVSLVFSPGSETMTEADADAEIAIAAGSSSSCWPAAGAIVDDGAAEVEGEGADVPAVMENGIEAA